MIRKTLPSKYAVERLKSSAQLVFGAFLLIIIVNLIFAKIYQSQGIAKAVLTNEGLAESKNEANATYSDSLYFAIITSATVGYGDIVPKDTVSKMFVSAHVLLSVLLFAFLTSTFLKFVEEIFMFKRINYAFQLGYIFIGSATSGLKEITDAAAKGDQVKLEHELKVTEEAFKLVYDSLNTFQGTPTVIMESYILFRDVHYISSTHKGNLTSEHWTLIELHSKTAFTKMLEFTLNQYER